jgi:hypothetical protein
MSFLKYSCGMLPRLIRKRVHTPFRAGRGVSAALVLFLLASGTVAQEPAVQDPLVPGPAAIADIFPILSLFEAALRGSIPWRPDWPLEVPPDAFLPAPEPGASLTLILSGGEELRLRRDPGGLLAEFPLFRGGIFYPVQTRLGAAGEIIGFSIETENPWEITVLEYGETLPSRVRVTRNGQVYFAVFQEEGGVSETWFDQEGSALGIFEFQYRNDCREPWRNTITSLSRGLSGREVETYHSDSQGSVSGVDTSRGSYSALYSSRGQPRYWERRITGSEPGTFGHFALQWDEQGRLTRITGTTGEDALGRNARGENSLGENARGELDIRYTYLEDSRGNWTERRETPMQGRFGFLVPLPGGLTRRQIGYRDAGVSQTSRTP